MNPQCCTTIIPVMQARELSPRSERVGLVSAGREQDMNPGVVIFSSCQLVKLGKTGKTDKEELELPVQPLKDAE